MPCNDCVASGATRIIRATVPEAAENAAKFTPVFGQVHNFPLRSQQKISSQ
jgi:hypothetical protein